MLAKGLVVAAVAGAGTVGLQQRAERERARDRSEATQVAAAFLGACEQGRWSAMTELTVGRDDPGSAYRRTSERLEVRSVQATPGPLQADGTTVPYRARLDLAGLGELAYDGQLHLVEQAGEWRVAFRLASLHPALADGEQLQRRSRPGPRRELADREGCPLLAASADLAANVLGRPGESGLERVLDDELQGTAGGAVVVGRAGSDQDLRVLQEYAGDDGAPLRTTLDLDVQRAAERALRAAPSRAALVAVDTATGQVHAVANDPVRGRPRPSRRTYRARCRRPPRTRSDRAACRPARCSSPRRWPPSPTAPGGGRGSARTT